MTELTQPALSADSDLAMLAAINRDAHLNYLHPNRLPWDEAANDAELAFLSTALIGRPGEEEKAVAYLYKELALLAELEMHVASVLVRVLSEIQAEPEAPHGRGDTLYHVLSCFAAEEINHANSFYQYIRHLSGRDIKLRENLFFERISLYHGNESPWVKLAALCATAYVGESVITVFERRLKSLDPMQQSFLTRLLHYHGLDEARHIQCDHFVFDHLVTRMGTSERQRMHALIDATEELNTRMAIGAGNQIKEAFGLDFTEGNQSAAIQLQLTLEFRRIVQGGDLISRVDDGLTQETAAILSNFSHAPRVHILGL